MNGETDSVMLKIFTDLVLNVPYEVFFYLQKESNARESVIASIKDFV